MNPRRNDICPCGSGKKYKKCCLLKEQIVEDINQQPDIREELEESLQEEALLVQALTNMRRYILDEKPHIKAYYKLRKLHGEIIDAMVRYYDDGKFTQTIDTNYTKSDRGYAPEAHVLQLLQCEFDLKSHTGVHAFYDMLMYKPAPNMRCITEEFIQKHRYRKAEKVEFLHSMLHSTLGLFEIVGTDPDEGYVFLKEVFTNAEYTITDVALSGTGNYSEIFLYTRIIDHQGVCLGTGLNFVFRKTDRFIQDYIRQHREDYVPHAEFLRFTQLYNRFSQDPNSIPLLTHSL